jgi:SH3 domain-containing YSC84-like protein 1
MSRAFLTRFTLIIGYLVPVLAGGMLSGLAWSQSEEEQLVTKAERTFDDFKADSKMQWLNKHLPKAKAVLIAPSIVKAGFILGGSGGHVLLVARDKQTGKWVGPAFYTLATISAGFQAGVEVSEAIMLVMSEKALDHLLRTSFKLGAEASVAAGPVGVGAESTVTADIVSFVRSKGIYGGVNIDGSVLKVNDKWNEAYYKKKATPADILVRQSAQSAQAEHLLSAITAATK